MTRVIEILAEEPPEDAEFETLDEAIAYALSDAMPGCVVAIHDVDCAHDGEDDNSCTCEPLELVTGAQS